jgi:hypothetical protein
VIEERAEFFGRLVEPAQLAIGHGYEYESGQMATVPVVPPAALRRMHPGDALLIHGTLPRARARQRALRRG